MSSTYQWIIEDTDNKGCTTTVVIGLEDDGDAEEHPRTGHTAETNGGRHHHYSPLQEDALHLCRQETQSEGKCSLSRRSHRSSGSRRRKAGGQALRSSGSGSGSVSHHSSAGSGGGGNGTVRSRRPAWMTTSVYGAEQLDDSENEREVPTSAAKRKARAAAAAAVVAGTSAFSPVSAFDGGHGGRRAPASTRGPSRMHDNNLVHPVFSDSDTAGDEAEEETMPRRGKERGVPQQVPLVSSVGRSVETDGTDRGDTPFAHDQMLPCNYQDVTSHLEGNEAPVGSPADHHDNGRVSPVTATFYFTPNTNAEARASVKDAMYSGGLLYPAYGFGSPQQKSAPRHAVVSTATQHIPAPAGPSYNKKLQKKHVRRQQEEMQQARENARGETTSFSAAVEALAMRAHKQLHHMPDYDSDHERRQLNQEPPSSAESEQGNSPLDVDSSGSLGSSPYRWHTSRLDSCGEEEDGIFPRQSWGRSSGDHEHDHCDEATTYRRVGSSTGTPFPAPSQQTGTHELSGGSGFFISPIHQLVAESTSPWEQGRGAGTDKSGNPFSFVFLGQGGLTSQEQQQQQQHPSESTHGGSTTLSGRRRTIHRGRSILRVPTNVQLPSTEPQDRRQRQQARSPQQLATSAAFGNQRRRAEGGVAAYDHELEKATEEAFADNLTTVLSRHGASGAEVNRRSRGRAQYGARTVAAATAESSPWGTVPSSSTAANVDDSDLGEYQCDVRSRWSAQAPSCGRKRRYGETCCSDDWGSVGSGGSSFSSSSDSSSDSESGSPHYSRQCQARHNRADSFASEEQRILKRLKRKRRRRRRTERAAQECGGSQPLGPAPSPFLAPSLELLPSSRADMREDLLESFFMDTKLHEDDFKLF